MSYVIEMTTQNESILDRCNEYKYTGAKRRDIEIPTCLLVIYLRTRSSIPTQTSSILQPRREDHLPRGK